MIAWSDTQGWVGPRAMRRVRIVDADKLRPAIEAALTLLSDTRPWYCKKMEEDDGNNSNNSNNNNNNNKDKDCKQRSQQPQWWQQQQQKRDVIIKEYY